MLPLLRAAWPARMSILLCLLLTACGGEARVILHEFKVVDVIEGTYHNKTMQIAPGAIRQSTLPLYYDVTARL